MRDLMRSVCVFAGSGQGNDSAYREVARALGHELGRRGITMVYGGGRIGLMGVAADAALAASGEVVGVIPEQLAAAELAHEGVTQLHVVGSMHARKALMEQLSGGFVALPGGFGTMDELFEILTWGQLGIHQKPVGLLNVSGYYDALLSWIDRAVRDGLVHAMHRGLFCVAAEPVELLAAMTRHQPPPIHPALTRRET